MTDPTSASEVDVLVANLAARGAAGEPIELHADSDPAGLAAIVPPGHELVVRDLSDLDHLRGAPRRVTGAIVVRDTASWLTYFDKHQRPGSEVFGDVRSGTVTAVLNAPAGPGEPAWADHRVVLQLEQSPAWRAWIALNGKFVGQEEFAEHLEARTPDLVDPDAATMLEVAQSFKATKGVQFESGSKLVSGERRFAYLESVEGRAGSRGELAVPTELKLNVQPWRGVAIVVPLTARFRFRVTREGLALGVVLDRVDDVLDAAWSSLLSELADGLGDRPVLSGPAPTYGH